MNKYKKIFIAGLVLTMVFVLSACDRNVSVLDEVEEENELAFGVTGQNEPFNFEDENGEITGFDVEVAEEIADRLDVEAKPVKAEEDKILTDLISSEYDMVVGVVPSTEEAKAQVDLTRPYYLETMTEEDYLGNGKKLAIATKKSDEKFINEVENILENMIDDGTYGEITEKWFDEDMTEEIKTANN